MIGAKRGQSAAGTAVLLAIIAGVIIMFIVVMPPKERAELLGEPLPAETSSTTNDGSVISNLLTTSPGRIDYLAKNELEHPLPVIYVNTFSETSILAEKNLVYAKRSTFSGKDSDFTFSLVDLERTNNVFLHFKVKSSTNNVVISLNGEVIFDAQPDAGSAIPVSLPKNMLKAENTLIFSASSPGLSFWKTNEINIEEIKVVGDITNVDAQYASNVFLVSETEKNNLEREILKFIPDCQYGESGKLSILINGNEIYNAIPDCDIAVIPLEFSPAVISEGENEITFKVDKGKYILTNVVLISKLKELDYPTFYFDLSNEQYELVQDGNRNVRLKLSFVDLSSSNYGQLLINGHTQYFDTKKSSYIIDIGEDTVQGPNSVKIKPKKTLEVRELKVDLIN